MPDLTADAYLQLQNGQPPFGGLLAATLAANEATTGKTGELPFVIIRLSTVLKVCTSADSCTIVWYS